MTRPKAPPASPAPPAPREGEQHVPAGAGGRALDGVVRDLFGLSWQRARDAVATGKVTVDGRVELAGTRRVRAGVAVAYRPRAPRPRRDALDDAAVVHVDAHVVVVDKPTGLAVIPYDPGGMARSLARRAAPDEEVTLDERVRSFLRRRGLVEGAAPPSLGVVHRIDKETSGLLVFTRSFAAKRSLASQFRVHSVEREYVALVHGHPRTQTFRSHLLEDRGDGLRGSIEAARRRGRNPKGEGREAVTHVEVLERVGPASLVVCRLETGRTHQIRIHLAEAGHPLLGERVYVRERAGPEIPAARVMLHARVLGFEHPAAGAVRFEREPPGDFAAALDDLRSVH